MNELKPMKHSDISRNLVKETGLQKVEKFELTPKGYFISFEDYFILINTETDEYEINYYGG